MAPSGPKSSKFNVGWAGAGVSDAGFAKFPKNLWRLKPKLWYRWAGSGGMEKEIRRAEAGYRRRAIIKLTALYVAAAVFGTVVIVWGRPWMQSYLGALEPRTALRLLSW